MDLDTRIALQNEVWNQYKVTVPDLERLLQDFTDHVSPVFLLKEDIDSFLSGSFKSYLEPIQGFIRTKSYRRSEIEKAAGPLLEVKDMPGFYRDEKCGYFWSETEVSVAGAHFIEFRLHGERPLGG